MRYKMTLAYYIHHILLQFDDSILTLITVLNLTSGHSISVYKLLIAMERKWQQLISTTLKQY